MRVAVRLRASSVLAILVAGSSEACTSVVVIEETSEDGGGDGASSSIGPATTSGEGGASPASCVPGTVEDCFDGPPEALGVGVCVSGTRVCAADGSSFGACGGQVLPTTEDCATAEDEDCDGTGCRAAPVWASGFGVAKSVDEGFSIAVDPFDNVLVAGYFEGDGLDFGGSPLANPAGPDAFLVKLDPSGNPLWSRSFGGPSGTDSQLATEVATDASANVIVAGSSIGTIDLGQGPVSGAGNGDGDLFLVKLGPSGDQQWARLMVGEGSRNAAGLVVDAGGSIFVAGTLDGSLEIDGQTLTSEGSQGDAFVLKLDPAGALIWARRFGDATQQMVTDLALDGDDVIVVGSTWGGTFDFGGALLPPLGAHDIFVAKLDASGDHVWSHRFGGGEPGNQVRIAVDTAGNTFVTGSFSGALDLGNGPLSGQDDVLLAKLDTEGVPVWSASFTGGPLAQRATSIAVNGQGDVILTGMFTEGIDLGGAPLIAGPQSFDIFLARFGNGGAHLWSTSYSGNEWGSIQQSNDVACDSRGNILMTGYFQGSVDFGEGPLVGAGNSDVFIAKIGP